MEKKPVYITDIIGEVVTATNAALKAKADSWLTINNQSINYVYGAESHVIQALRNIGNNGGKYPMIALMMPVRTARGNSNGFYGEAILPAIYIATLSDNTSSSATKYTRNFKPILFPIYYEFLNQLSRHRDIINTGGADFIRHTLSEYPADVTDKDNTIFTDFLDILALTEVLFTIKQQPLINCANRIN
jgi:hypothetical protein